MTERTPDMPRLDLEALARPPLPVEPVEHDSQQLDGRR